MPLPPEVLQNLSNPSELASVFEAEMDYPLGLLKVKAGNLRGILMLVRVKLEKTTKIPLHQ